MTRSNSILVVDDDPDVADAVSEALQFAEVPSRVAVNGREALHMLEDQRADLILLDLMMPVMDGFAFAREQKRRPELADIPVVIMTADGRAQQKAESLHAAGFLQKPVSLERLLGEVARVLGE